MKIRDLPKEWQEKSGEKRTVRKYEIQLPLHVAASISALSEMYPGRTQTEIITDLLSAALHELEEGFPYIQGERVIAEDEFGDQMYEDIGPTPQFGRLLQKHTRLLENELAEG